MKRIVKELLHGLEVYSAEFVESDYGDGDDLIELNEKSDFYVQLGGGVAMLQKDRGDSVLHIGVWNYRRGAEFISAEIIKAIDKYEGEQA